MKSEVLQMDLLEAIKNRHSVRSYENKPLEPNAKNELTKKINEYNKESGLHIQLICDEPKAFDSFMAHYGKFSGVTNYIAMIGKKGKDLDTLCGYYGEKLVLLAQQLGLNSCWVAMTYKKIPSAFKIENGEKVAIVIALGYGKTQGVAHKSKDFSSVCNVTEPVPEWFRKGVEAALLAPTAMNQQKFTFSLDNNKVTVKSGVGFYSKIDLGIVKCHFEIGAGKDNFIWG